MIITFEAPRAGLRHAAVPYVTPFAVFIVAMAMERLVHVSPAITYSVRFFLVLGVMLYTSRDLITFRASRPLQSVLLGLAVFLIWIGPDVIFGYRHYWLFENSVTGAAASPLPPDLRTNWWFMAIRTAGATLLVPVLEELFWRGWMMRWLIKPDFLEVPLGTYVPSAFWIVAVLFASEHGPYWEVGLIAGILYNWWMIRTRNLGDCVVAHAVTNGVLSAYVLLSGQWQYWL